MGRVCIAGMVVLLFGVRIGGGGVEAIEPLLLSLLDELPSRAWEYMVEEGKGKMRMARGRVMLYVEAGGVAQCGSTSLIKDEKGLFPGVVAIGFAFVCLMVDVGRFICEVIIRTNHKKERVFHQSPSVLLSVDRNQWLLFVHEQLKTTECPPSSAPF